MNNVIKHKGQIFVAALLICGIFLVGQEFHLGDFPEAMGLVGGCFIMTWLLSNPELYDKPYPACVHAVPKSKNLGLVLPGMVLAFVGIVLPKIIS